MVTKITVSTAMRARDVSRPRAEHFTEAAAPGELPARPADQPPPSAPARSAAAPVPAAPRRRRRRRS